MSDSNTRSLIKAVSWRLTGSGATFLISWLFIEDVAVASGIATLQIITNTILYFIHERLWNRVGWGKYNE